MKPTCRRPAWWQLYLLGLAIVGLLILGARAHLSPSGHELAAIAALVAVYGLIELWLRANWRGLVSAGLEESRQARPVRRTLVAPELDHLPVRGSAIPWVEDPEEA
jgi:hypothetical protein